LKTLIKMLTAIPGWHYAAWPLARRFVAGRTYEEGMNLAQKFSNAGYPIIINYAHEHANTPEDIYEAHLFYDTAIAQIASVGLKAKIAIKLSQFGLLSSEDELKKNFWHIQAIVSHADTYGIFVSFDAEEYTTIERYETVVIRLIKNGAKNIEQVIQTNHNENNWFGFVKMRARWGIPIRVCTGAYRQENKTLPFETEYERIDEQYYFAVAELTSRGIPVEIATGNPKRIAELKKMLLYNNHFAMLYGIHPSKAKEMRSIGHTPWIYLVIGPHWKNYVRRRLIENPEYIKLAFTRQAWGIDAYI
jgi:proline dehydrogenase